MRNDVEYLFIYTTSASSLLRCIFRSFAHVSIGLFDFLLLRFKVWFGHMTYTSMWGVLFVFCFLCFSGFFATPCGMWSLSSLTRNQTPPPAVEVWSLNHWTTREVLVLNSFFHIFIHIYIYIYIYINFIYFWLHWVSIAARRLCCC